MVNSNALELKKNDNNNVGYKWRGFRPRTLFLTLGSLLCSLLLTDFHDAEPSNGPN